MPLFWMLRRVALVRTEFRSSLTHPSSGLQKSPNIVPSSSILITLIMDAIRSSETSFLTRATLRDIPEDGIFHTHRRENLKSWE
jgi:hypothetical protein